MQSPSTEIKLLDELIRLADLRIPSYQRPYTWKVKNVLQLLDDIFSSSKKAPLCRYRIGTIILHDTEDAWLDIVDGQQRLTTLSIVYYVLNQTDLPLLACNFRHETSKANISQNHDAVKLWLNGLNVAERHQFTDYLLDHCELVVITLKSLGEAFQFFDAQNARGKALAPTDLLKAFHLRAMDTPDQKIARANCAIQWEKAIDQGLLNWTIGTYLFRIRKWVSGKPAYEFGINDINEFKGINADELGRYPYLRSCERFYKLQQLSGEIFPYQLTQTIINGSNFFGMITYYTEILSDFFDKNKTTEFQRFYKLNTGYDGSKRNGDQYVKRMFKALILLYIDRFGDADFEQVYPYLYLWAYRLRLQKGSVRYASIDNYILNDNLFQRLVRSHFPQDLLALRNNLMLPKAKIERHIPEIETVYTNYHLLPE